LGFVEAAAAFAGFFFVSSDDFFFGVGDMEWWGKEQLIPR
jgi:hypothetical protein